VLDPEQDRIRIDDNLTFTATRWALLEASLVSVPAGPAAAPATMNALDEMPGLACRPVSE
jgi:hypothetical protein